MMVSRLGGIFIALILALLASELSAQERPCTDQQIDDILFARILEGNNNHSVLQPVPVIVRVTKDYAEYEALSKELKRMSTSVRPIIALEELRQFEGVAEIEDDYRELTAGVFVVVDPEFMSEGSPKFNELLTTYRDAVFTDEYNMVIDPFLDTLDKGPLFVQVAPAPSATNLAYRIEAAAAAMRVPRLMISERFRKYQGSLATMIDLSKEREPVVVRCIMEYFKRATD
jgi:hypothetical protein